jgi:vacuolar protein sorting-associated protein 13A/C
MNIVIQNPLISLKPNPESKEFLQIDLGLIRIVNEREKNNKRLL